MKKILAILLTVILVVSGCWGALSVSAEGTKDYESPASWYRIGNGKTISEATGTKANVGIMLNSTDITYAGGEKSIYSSSGNNVWTHLCTLLDGLTSGTQYKLSFKYYIPSTTVDAGTEGFLNFGLYNEGAANSGGRATTAVSGTSKVFKNGDQTGEDANGNAKWAYHTITFTAGSTPLYFSIGHRTTSATAVYIDDFKVVATADIATIAPTTTTSPMDTDYNDYTIWGLYDYTAGNIFPNYLDGTAHEHRLSGADGVVKFAATTQLTTVAVKINDLVVGKTYTLSYKYSIPSTATAGGAGFIARRGLYPVGTAVVDANGPATSGALANTVKNITANTAGAWATDTVTFTATATETMLAFTMRYGGSGDPIVSITDVQVAEPGEYPYTETSWKKYKGQTLNGTSATNAAWPSTEVYPGGQANSYSASYSINQTNLAASALKLNNLVAGQKYRVSFKYHIATGHINGSGGYIMRASVCANGTSIDTAGMPATTLSGYKNMVVTQADSSVQWANMTLDFTADATANYLVVSIRSGNDAGLRAIDEIVVTPLAVETFTESKAAVRLYLNQDEKTEENKKPGLRIYNKLDANWASALELVEFGSVAIKASNLKTSQLTLNTAGAISAVSYKSLGESKSLIWAKDSASTTFTSYLSGISAKNYGQDYVVRAYAKDINGNVYYGEQIRICIYDVVKTIFDTSSTWNNDCIIAQDFIDAGNAAAELDDAVVTYDEWKAAQ